jgi:hypothetical protein
MTVQPIMTIVLKMRVKRGIPPSCEAPLLPKRVVNVAGNALFLFESGGKGAQYLALSHRWGNIDMQKTTTAVLEEYKHGIALRDVPGCYHCHT